MQSVLKFRDFLNASPSPYHVVANVVDVLQKHGFTELKEGDKWAIKPSTKHYVVRNGSSIIAFALGPKWTPGNGFSILGAHTDSPVLRLKPKSNSGNNGYLQVGVEIYGGGLWPTWFDRDLSLAGKVIVRSGNGHKSRLVHIEKPLMRIPTLAIHLQRDQSTKLEFNKEDQLKPILGLGNMTADEDHAPELLKLLSSELNTVPESIEDFELVLYDTQPAQIGGINDEFVFGGRLDNINSSFCAVEALVGAQMNSDDTSGSIVSLFDHEEVGSASSHGAASNFLEAVISRLAPGNFYESLAKSFLLSSDVSHAVHPNYAAKHEGNHKPRINDGPVIKVNANQRYATTAPGVVFLQNIAQDIPLQKVVVRNDSPCGSTIGPIIASRLGIRCLDVGNPILSMHSIREMAGTSDVSYSIELFKKFFENYFVVEPTVDWQ